MPGGAGDIMQKAQAAMERAKNLDTELEVERITIEKGPVTVVFDGRGMMVSVKIDPESAGDVEELEDMITLAARDGFDRSTALRAERTAEITKDLPNIPGLM